MSKRSQYPSPSLSTAHPSGSTDLGSLETVSKSLLECQTRYTDVFNQYQEQVERKKENKVDTLQRLQCCFATIEILKLSVREVKPGTQPPSGAWTTTTSHATTSCGTPKPDFAKSDQPLNVSVQALIDAAHEAFATTAGKTSSASQVKQLTQELAAAIKKLEPDLTILENDLNTLLGTTSSA